MSSPALSLCLGFPPFFADSSILPASAIAAFSFRKINPSYTGNCLRVRRSSDNTEQDIGFSGSEFNSAAYTSFVGGSNGYLVAWYSQVTGNYNASQPSASAQPQIVLNVVNSRHVLRFNGSTHYLSLGSNATFNFSDFSINICAAFSSSSQRWDTFWSRDDGGGVTNKWIYGHGINSNSIQFHINPGNLFFDYAFTKVIGQFNSWHFVKVGSSLYQYKNGANVVSSTNSVPTPFTSSPLLIGQAEGNGFFFGDIAETFISNAGNSSSEVSAIYTNQKTLFNLP